MRKLLSKNTSEGVYFRSKNGKKKLGLGRNPGPFLIRTL